jgi:hypothetical protein
MKQNETKSCKISNPRFYCEKCDYASNNKYNFNKHIATTKHKMKQNETKSCKKLQTPFCANAAPVRRDEECSGAATTRDTNFAAYAENAKIMEADKKSCKKVARAYQCAQCGMYLNSRTTLWRHGKKCGGPRSDAQEEALLCLTEKMVGLTEATNNVLSKLTENPQMVINSANNSTNHMTINMFLDRHCKDAMNLTDFVNKVKVSLEDLLYTREHGYVKGVSNIFVKNLSDMDPKDRPIHCSDRKRLQFYIKEQDQWTKDKQNTKLDRSIESITHKQIKRIKQWVREHPDYLDDDALTKEWQELCNQTMGGGSDAERSHNKKGIKKEVSNTICVKEVME